MAENTEEPKEPEKKLKQDRFLTIAHRIAIGEAGGIYLYCVEDGRFYHYSEGYWVAMYDVEFLSKVSLHMPEITRYAISNRKQIVDNFRHIACKKLSTFNWSDMINLKNTMINPYKGEEVAHHSSFYSTNRLNYDYISDAVCPLWLKTLNEIMEGNQDKVNILQEFFGYCLTRETKQHKALLLLGESRSGKSTILQTLRALVGMSNCSSVPLKYISNPQYTAMLINKLVNIDTDVSAKAELFEAEFKTITSGEPVAVNQKYVAAFDFVPYCKVVMAANIFPKITDHSSAFYNRLILIPCDRVFSPAEQNRNLVPQLQQELPGIFNWSLEGLRRLEARGRFDSSDFMKEAIEDLENENNPVNTFLDEHLEIWLEGEVYIEKPWLYEKYCEWCNRTGNFRLSNIKFAGCLHRRFFRVTPKDSRASQNGPRVWRNLRYIGGVQRGEVVTGWQK